MVRKIFGKTRMRFRTALLLIITPLIIMLIIALFVSDNLANDVYEDSEHMYYDNLYQINSGLVNADRDFYQAMLGALNYYDMSSGMVQLDEATLAEQLPKNLDDYKSNKQQTIEGVNAVIEMAKQNPDLYTGTTLEGDSNNFEYYANLFVSDFAAWESVYDLEAGTGDWTAFNVDFAATREALSNMSDIVEAWAEKEDAILSQEIHSRIIRIVIIFAALIVLLFIIVLIVANAMTNGVRRIRVSIDKMAGGDFATAIDRESPIYEFSRIAEASDDMRQKLQTALTNVINSCKSVNDGADGTKTMIADSQRTTSDINQAVYDLANGATAMATDVQSTSDITIEIGNAVEQVLMSASGNMEKGREVYDESTRVQEQLGELQTAGQNTQAKASQVADSVNETATVVADISQAAEAIISIASQTNLLALNASIEAARAGEAGKGFAVVADNIKNLAEESNQSANEITDMLKRISALSETNKELTEQIKDATETEAEALESMVASFDSMRTLLLETEAGNKQITELVEALNHNKNSIMDSVESLSSVSQENAASTEQTSASLSQLETNMENVVSQAETLQSVAEELQESISMFTVE
ncbi:MAG: methyl-accepting chemotaxis protein [Lachnospiraceae bacterium]|nr:methyl-accepting chemotaxis protein [Lachnospiraceae bacterium]